MIESTDNPKIKYLASLKLPKYRKKHGVFIVEGARMAAAALAHARVRELLYTGGAVEEPPAAARVVRTELSARCMKKISDIQNPPACAALVELPAYDLETIIAEKTRVRMIIAAGLQDPGNVGTIIRTADAAGFDAVCLVENSADPFGPKAVRASASSIFTVPVVETESAELFSLLKAAGIETIFAEPRGGEPVDTFAFAAKTAVVVGSEGAGVPDTLDRYRDKTVTVPIRGSAESLNAAVAAAIVMYRLI